MDLIELYRQMGDVYEKELKDPDRAVEAYRDIVRNGVMGVNPLGNSDEMVRSIWGDYLEKTEIYIVRHGESLGPFTKQELLENGSIEPNDLIKLGTDGRPFPAAFILQGSV